MAVFRITVRTRFDPGALLTPVSFTLRDRTFQITEIVDTWHGADHSYYKLTADDGNLYVIRHDLDSDSWELVQMEVVGN